MSFLNIRSVLRDPDPAAGGGGPPPPPPGGAPPPPPGGSPPPPPSPFYKGLYGDDGKIDKTRLDSLPDHLKPHKDYFAKYDTVEALLTGAANANKLAVGKALAPLRGDEPAEVITERNTLLDTILNVPKEAKDYGLTREKVAADLPAEFWNQEGADQFASLAKKHHLSPDAVKDIIGLQVGMTKASLEQGKAGETQYYADQQKAFETAMEKAGVPLEEANSLVDRAIATAGFDPKLPIFKNAATRSMAVQFAKMVSESKLKQGDGTASKDDPIEQARDIARNPQNADYKAYHDPVHPNHQAVKDKWNALYRQGKPR